MIYAKGPRELQTEGIEAPSFDALLEIAIENLRKQGPSGVVCGPISTGGTNDQALNFMVFNATIQGLQEKGESVFSQVPYEFGLRRLAFDWEAKGNKGYCTPILEVFYAGLFETGLITQGWFIPGWCSSHGSRYEREKIPMHGGVITDLSRDEILRFLLEKYTTHQAAKIYALLASD